MAEMPMVLSPSPLRSKVRGSRRGGSAALAASAAALTASLILWGTCKFLLSQFAASFKGSSNGSNNLAPCFANSSQNAGSSNAFEIALPAAPVSSKNFLAASFIAFISGVSQVSPAAACFCACIVKAAAATTNPAPSTTGNAAVVTAAAVIAKVIPPIVPARAAVAPVTFDASTVPV